MAKTSIWSGQHLTSFFEGLVRWIRRRFSRSEAPSDAPRAESQVRSLSGLIVVLLAAVVTLVYWATSPQAWNNPVIQIFSGGPTAIPGLADDPAVAPQLPAAEQPFLRVGGTIVFSMYSGAQQELFALSAEQEEPVRLTDNPSDDRYPVWSPDGNRIAFSSRRDGNWELYILDLPSGEIIRLTYDLAYESAPSWSPDGEWLTYEAYYDGNLDIYLIRADAGEGPYPVTRHPAPDFDPAWGTGGREIAYVSWRGGNQDIYVISLNDPSEDRAINVTRTPDINEEAPSWNPDGTLLAYSAVENGVSLVYAQDISDLDSPPFVVGQGHSPTWSPDGKNLIFLFDRQGDSLFLTGQFGAWNTSVQAFALPENAFDPNWSAAELPSVPRGSLAFAVTAPTLPAYEEPMLPRDDESTFPLITLPGVINEAPYLSDQVDGSFIALKNAISQAAGWDFLGRLNQVWWELDRPSEPGQDYRNWHKAGRAFDVVQAYNQGENPQIELVPEQVGPDLYWRLYVRCAVQDGSLGEPLHDLPWDFEARTGGDVEAYEAGGQFKNDTPSGYYVDFTQLAQVFGWYRIPASQSWRSNWPGVLYWQYEKRDDLDWWAAMLELYPSTDLQATFYTPTPPLPTPIPQETPTPEEEEEEEEGEGEPTPSPDLENGQEEPSS